MNPFGASAFIPRDADGDGSLGDEMAEKRLNPLHALGSRRFGSAKLPAKKAPPSHSDVHGHLDNAKKAPSDDEKRSHVFRALTALNQRMKAAPHTPMPDMGAS